MMDGNTKSDKESLSLDSLDGHSHNHTSQYTFNSTPITGTTNILSPASRGGGNTGASALGTTASTAGVFIRTISSGGTTANPTSAGGGGMGVTSVSAGGVSGGVSPAHNFPLQLSATSAQPPSTVQVQPSGQQSSQPIQPAMQLHRPHKLTHPGSSNAATGGAGGGAGGGRKMGTRSNSASRNRDGTVTSAGAGAGGAQMGGGGMVMSAAASAAAAQASLSGEADVLTELDRFGGVGSLLGGFADGDSVDPTPALGTSALLSGDGSSYRVASRTGDTAAGESKSIPPSNATVTATTYKRVVAPTPQGVMLTVNVDPLNVNSVPAIGGFTRDDVSSPNTGVHARSLKRNQSQGHGLAISGAGAATTAAGTTTASSPHGNGGGASGGSSRHKNNPERPAHLRGAKTDSEAKTVYDEWNGKMKLFRYILQLAGLNQKTSVFYRTYLRLILWGCVLLCISNMGFRTASYRNILFDLGLALAHVWLAVSYEVWYSYLHTRQWIVLVNISTRHRGSGFLRIVYYIGIGGVLFVFAGCLIIYSGWLVPIWKSMIDQFIHSDQRETYFGFLIVHGVVMTVLIVPWVAVCFCAWVLFFLSVSAHKSDISAYESIVSGMFSSVLAAQPIAINVAAAGSGVNSGQNPGNAAALAAAAGSGVGAMKAENGGGAAGSGINSPLAPAPSSVLTTETVWSLAIQKHRPLRERLEFTCGYFGALYAAFLFMCCAILLAAVYDFNNLLFLSGSGVTFNLWELAQDILLLGLGIVGMYCGLWTTASLSTTWRLCVRRLNDLPSRGGFQLTKHNLPLHAALIQYLTTTDHNYTVFGITIDYDFAIGLCKFLFELIVIMLFAVNLTSGSISCIPNVSAIAPAN